MQRGVLVLILALSVVVLLTVVISQLSPYKQAQATHDLTRSIRSQVNNQESQRAFEQYMALGREFREQTDLKKAEEMYRQALQFDDRSPDAFLALGMIMLERQRVSQAESYFSRLPELAPANSLSYIYLAFTQINLGELTRAEKTISLGLERSTDNLTGRLHLMQACVDQLQHEQEQAIAHLRQAHAELGAAIVDLVEAGWAEPVKGMPYYQGLKSNLQMNQSPAYAIPAVQR